MKKILKLKCKLKRNVRITFASYNTAMCTWNIIQSKRARTTTVKIVYRMKIHNELNRGKEKLNGFSCSHINGKRENQSTRKMQHKRNMLNSNVSVILARVQFISAGCAHCLRLTEEKVSKSLKKKKKKTVSLYS